MSPTLTGMAFDTTNSLVGSFTLSALSFTAGPQSGGIFSAAANTETFTYSNPDGDTVTETWHVTFIQDNTPQPKFFGTGGNDSHLWGRSIPGRLRFSWYNRQL
jgi:hypothetical protein